MVFKNLIGGTRKPKVTSTETTRDPETPLEKNGEYLSYVGAYNSDIKYHGFGVLINTLTNSKYEGHWSNGVKEGQGIQWYPSGERYDGQWRNNNMEGEGIIYYPNEDKFEGVWENNRRVKGVFYCHECGVVFRENWVNDAPGNEGQIDFNTGGKYIGEIKWVVMGKHQIKNYAIYRDGFGEMYYSNSCKYIGYWKNDMRKGFGVLITNNGPKYYGNWHRGKKTGHGIQIELDGTFYEGYHQQDERKGNGKLCLPYGDNINGEWHGFKDSKLTNAFYNSGKFTDAPRPVRALFLANVTGIQRSEDTTMFTTTEKWTPFVREITESVNFELMTLEKISESLDLSISVSNDPIREVLNRFVRIFNWIYLNSCHNKKDLLYNKQTAIDDVSSFLSTITDYIEQKLPFPPTRKIYESIISFIFPQIYETLFPLYISVNKNRDTILQAKIEELKEVTTAVIGVKPRFHLLNHEKSPPLTPTSPTTDGASTSGDKNQSGATRNRPFNPISPRPSALHKIVENEPIDELGKISSKNTLTPPPQQTTATVVANNNKNDSIPPADVLSPRSHSKIGIRSPSPTTIRSQINNSKDKQSHEQHSDDSEEDSEPLRQRRQGFTIATLKKFDQLPYQRVIDSLKKIEQSKTPKEKVDCLTTAAQGILACVDEANPDKTKQIVMGAEDKFPVLIYALIRANISNLWSHSLFIQDFLEERLGDESIYRTSELMDAIKYIQSLDWIIRDANDVLFPLQMATSAVSWEAFKGAEKIKFSDDTNINAESFRIQLQLIASTIFRLISQRISDIYSPFLIPLSLGTIIKEYEPYFQSIFSLKEVGLVLRKENMIIKEETGGGSGGGPGHHSLGGENNSSSVQFWIHFELKHPLYVYERLSIACVSEEKSDSK